MIFTGNIHKKHARSRGFHPSRFGSPLNAITPVKVIQLLNKEYIIIALSAGAVRGDRHCPLHHITRAEYFITKVKGDSPELKGIFADIDSRRCIF